MEILAVIVGWLLGVASTPVLEWRQRNKERTDLRKGVLLELETLRSRLATHAYMIWNRRGELTIDRLNWVATALESCVLISENERIARSLRGIVDNGADQLALLNQRNQQLSKGGQVVTTARRVEAPFLSSHLSRLVILTPAEQQALLYIDTQLRLLNELTDEHREFFALTFNPDIRDQNRRIIQKNLHDTDRRIADRAEYIADQIHQLQTIRGAN